MGGFRAKDADRDRCVEVIEAAYADGQLGDADRELRVSRALTAETLDELQSLTRDLQAPAAVVAPPPMGAAVPPRPQRLGAVLVAVGALVVMLVVGVAGIALFAASDPDTATSQGVGVIAPTVSEEASEVGTTAPFEMAAPEVRRFLRTYERKFGTLDAWEAAFYPTRVGVEVPVRGSRPRMERWSWDGTWRQDTQASQVTGPRGLVDLGEVDVHRLFDNIARARRSLEVQRGRLTHVLVNDWGDGPGVNIYIGNRFGESGYLRTTPSGEVVRAYPYES